MKAGVLSVDQLVRPVSGGIGVYISGILGGLVALGVDDRLDLLSSSTERRVGPTEWRGGRIQTRFSYRIQQRIWDHSSRISTPNGRGVAFEFYHAFSLGGPALRMRIPKAIAVYDLLFRTAPETFPARARDWHERRFADVVQSDARVVTLARATVGSLVDAGIASERIVVIPPGVEHVPPADVAGTAKLLAGAGVDGRYLMVLGTIEPRKNLPRILAAYQQYRVTTFDPVPLVIVGPKGWGPDLVVPLGAHVVGEVSAAIVAGLLGRAQALIYVPLQEGFGLPVIEALAAAVPVVTSRNIPAADLGGLGVDPIDVDGIADAMERIVNDDPLRSQLVTHGLMAVEGLSWVRAAQQHVRLWEELTE